jgi:hypothetical protein
MSMLGDDAPTGDTEWYSIVPPDSPTNGNTSMNRSHTAPSTPGSSISWRGGQSTFYETFHCQPATVHLRALLNPSPSGSEFSPSRMFPQRSSSGASSKPGSDSLSQSSTTAGDLPEVGRPFSCATRRPSFAEWRHDCVAVGDAIGQQEHVNSFVGAAAATQCGVVAEQSIVVGH